MSFTSWIRSLTSRLVPTGRANARRRRGHGPIHRLRPCLEALEDRTAPAIFTVTSTLDDGSSGTLRWAINQANADTDPTSLINFNIASSGVQTIQVGSSGAYADQGLPALTHPTVIDGTTEPGFAGTPIIVLNGVQAGSASGLYITASNSTIKGLVIQQFQQFGIALWLSGDNTVAGNYIGTDVTGTQALGNGYDGVLVHGGSGNTVGGTAQGERNLISANHGAGVKFEDRGINPLPGNVLQGNFIGTDVTGKVPLGNGEGEDVFSETNDLIGGTDTNAPGAPLTGAGNLISANGLDGINHAASSGDYIQGNYIGTDVTGTSPLGNTFGLLVENASSNWIGTTGLSDSGDRNVISGNVQAGVALINGTQDNVVAGNYIGTDATGVQPLANGVTGIGINFAQNNQIGGLGPLATTLPNTIAFNDLAGVWIASNAGTTTGNSVRDNVIHDNAGLGIDLGGGYDFSTLTPVPGPDGVTPNDSEGHSPPNNPNNFQDFPVLASAVSSSTDTAVSGTFSEADEPNTALTLDFYANASADPSGYGQGQTHLGSATITTDANGKATFAADLATGNLAGQGITATATDPFGNTSEFALDVQATAAPSQTFAQFLQTALPQSTATANSLTVLASASTTPATVLQAVNALTGVTQPVTIVLDLGGGNYSTDGVAYNPSDSTTAQNVTFVIQNGTLDPAFPALTVGGGRAIVQDCTLTTTGDAPTILVSGGRLMLRNDVIQESTGFNDAALSITGGTVDLGTIANPGGNTINVNGTGTFLSNTTGNRISDLGDQFESNGQALVPLTVNSNSALMLAGNSPPPLTGSVNGTPFTSTINYTTPSGATLTVTLGTAATSTSPVGQYAITATLSGASAGNYLLDPGASTVGTLYVVSVGADPTSTAGAQAVTFWDNKGNAKLITAADLSSLDFLNLVNQGGAAFDPKSVAQLQAWLSISPNATAAYQLAVQLAALDLNVLASYVKATDLVYAGALLPYATADNISGLTSGGFIDVRALLNAANAVLAQVSPGAPTSDPNQAYEAALTQVLQAVNGNTDFVKQEVLWNLTALDLVFIVGL
jgi:hypothetical protein